MKKAVIIQARTGSTRLPGKVLLPLEDKMVLEHVIERCMKINQIDEIILATTDLHTDTPIVEVAKKWEIPFFQGSEEDVLARYYYAAKQQSVDIIVRVTSDCPLLDPLVSEEVLRTFTHSGQYDYVSNTLVRSFPRGLDTEVFSFDALEKAFREAKITSHREHVTPYIYQHPQWFKSKSIISEQDHSYYRWTLDTLEDWELIQEIYRQLYNPERMFHYQDILELMRVKPQLAQINAHIEQKKVIG